MSRRVCSEGTVSEAAIELREHAQDAARCFGGGREWVSFVGGSRRVARFEEWKGAPCNCRRCAERNVQTRLFRESTITMLGQSGPRHKDEINASLRVGRGCGLAPLKSGLSGMKNVWPRDSEHVLAEERNAPRVFRRLVQP